MKAFVTFSWMNSSTRIICPVLEMGSHSVSPSTMPRITVFNNSISVISKMLSSPQISNGKIPPIISHFTVFCIMNRRNYK